MVLWGEDFPLLHFCLFGWELFVEEGEEREVLTTEYPLFPFAPRRLVAFEGSERRGMSVSVVGRGWGFGVGGREGDIFQEISPFEAVAAMRAHLFFGLGGILEDFWKLFFFFFRDEGIGSV